jgi:hypothetical protein
MLKLLPMMTFLFALAGDDNGRYTFLHSHIIDLTQAEELACDDETIAFQLAELKCSHPLVGMKCDEEEIRTTEHDAVECVNTYRKMKLVEENEEMMKLIDEATEGK